MRTGQANAKWSWTVVPWQLAGCLETEPAGQLSGGREPLNQSPVVCHPPVNAANQFSPLYGTPADESAMEIGHLMCRKSTLEMGSGLQRAMDCIEKWG